MVTYSHNVLRYVDLILVQIQLAGISSVMGKQAIVAAELHWHNSEWTQIQTTRDKGSGLFSGRLQQY